jgi:hypothetical protein
MFNARLEPVAQGSDWTQFIHVRDGADGEDIDFTGCDIEATLKHVGRNSIVVSGSTTDTRVTIVQPGVIYLEFLADDLKNLSIGDYEIGLTVRRDGYTESLVIGALPIVDGAVKQ